MPCVLVFGRVWVIVRDVSLSNFPYVTSFVSHHPEVGTY